VDLQNTVRHADNRAFDILGIHNHFALAHDGLPWERSAVFQMKRPPDSGPATMVAQSSFLSRARPEMDGHYLAYIIRLKEIKSLCPGTGPGIPGGGNHLASKRRFLYDGTSRFKDCIVKLAG
jgi:hypothetical protein